jgi:hypothetical protein
MKRGFFARPPLRLHLPAATRPASPAYVASMRQLWLTASASGADSRVRTVTEGSFPAMTGNSGHSSAHGSEHLMVVQVQAGDTPGAPGAGVAPVQPLESFGYHVVGVQAEEDRGGCTPGAPCAIPSPWLLSFVRATLPRFGTVLPGATRVCSCPYAPFA